MKEKQAFQEIHALSLCNHPNLVCLHEFFLSERYVSIIFNQVKGKMLFSALKTMKKDYTVKKALSIIFQIAKAVNHCRFNGIIWCNLSHENIFYDGENITCSNFSEVVIKGHQSFTKKLMGIKGKRGIFIFSYFE